MILQEFHETTFKKLIIIKRVSQLCDCESQPKKLSAYLIRNIYSSEGKVIMIFEINFL